MFLRSVKHRILVAISSSRIDLDREGLSCTTNDFDDVY